MAQALAPCLCVESNKLKFEFSLKNAQRCLVISTMSDDFESYLHLYTVAKRRIKMTVHDIGTPSMQPSGTAFLYICRWINTLQQNWCLKISAKLTLLQNTFSLAKKNATFTLCFAHQFCIFLAPKRKSFWLFFQKATKSFSANSHLSKNIHFSDKIRILIL